MKHKRKEVHVNWSTSKRRCKDIANTITPTMFEEVNFNVCNHAFNWSKDQTEEAWAMSVGLEQFRGLDWLAIHKP